jgi:hypothetical protein
MTVIGASPGVAQTKDLAAPVARMVSAEFEVDSDRAVPAGIDGEAPS